METITESEYLGGIGLLATRNMLSSTEAQISYGSANEAIASKNHTINEQLQMKMEDKIICVSYSDKDPFIGNLFEMYFFLNNSVVSFTCKDLGKIYGTFDRMLITDVSQSDIMLLFRESHTQSLSVKHIQSMCKEFLHLSRLVRFYQNCSS